MLPPLSTRNPHPLHARSLDRLNCAGPRDDARKGQAVVLIHPLVLPDSLVPSLLRLLSTPPHQQVASNKRLQVAVEHTIHVAHLDLCAVVLHHPVGLQDVRTNL